LKFGHIVVVCHYRFDSDYQLNSTLSLQELVFCNSSSTSDVRQNASQTKNVVPSAMILNSENQDLNLTTWIPDSGASFHVTRESQNIQ